MKIRLTILVLILVCSRLIAQDVICPTILNTNPNNSSNTSTIIFFDMDNMVLDTCICTRAGVGSGTEGQYNCGTCMPFEWSHAMIDDEGPCYNDYDLPVELKSIDYTINSNYNKINWITKSEQNNAYFNLDHSSDGYNFNQVAQIIGAGSSTTPQYYSQIHYFSTESVNYYRLSQVDLNGKYKTIAIISINNSLKDKELIKTLNLLGQEVDENYSGLVIEYYSNETIVKTVR